MSVTTAIAAGYQSSFCEPGCQRTSLSPLFDTRGWLPADTVGWLPAMLLPSGNDGLARAVIDRGIKSDGSQPAGTVYLVTTQDSARNVRAAGYADVESLVGKRILIREAVTPIEKPPIDIVAYFTGAVRVQEMSALQLPSWRDGGSFDLNRRSARGWAANVGAGMVETRSDRLLRFGIRTLRSPGQISESRGFPRPLSARRHAARGLLEECGDAGAGIVHRRAVGAAFRQRNSRMMLS